MTWSDLGGFLLAVILGAMVPGPTTALIIRRGALGGVRAALPVVAGMEAGLFLWALAAAVGLAALVAASEIAYTALRIAGAVVLVVLGVRAWWASRTVTDVSFADQPAAEEPWWRSATTGLVTNLANPKVAVFMFAFYPQFIPPGSNVLMTTVFLASAHIVVDAGWFLLVATFVGMARKYFTRGAVRRRLEQVTGTVLIGLGIRLAVEKL